MRQADAGSALEHEKIFVQRQGARGQVADLAVVAMRIADAHGQPSGAGAAGVARHRPIGIALFELRQPLVKIGAAVGDQPHVLVAKDDMAAARRIDKAVQAVIGGCRVGCGIIDEQEFARGLGEAVRAERREHGGIFGPSRHQRTNAVADGAGCRYRGNLDGVDLHCNAYSLLRRLAGVQARDGAGGR